MLEQHGKTTNSTLIVKGKGWSGAATRSQHNEQMTSTYSSIYTSIFANDLTFCLGFTYFKYNGKALNLVVRT